MSVRPALFRQEAIEFQQHHLRWGSVATLQPVSTKLLSWLLAASSAAVVIFLFIAQYARKETVVGYLTPTAGTAKIFAPQRGTIKKFMLRKGNRSAKAMYF